MKIIVEFSFKDNQDQKLNKQKNYGLKKIIMSIVVSFKFYKTVRIDNTINHHYPLDEFKEVRKQLITIK